MALPGAPTPTDAAWRRFDRSAPTLLRVGFAFAVLWFTWTPWPRHRAPLHRLPRATADAILRRAGRRSGLLHRQLLLALKLVVALTTEASR